MTSKIITIVTFYKFVNLPNFKQLQPEIKNFCTEQNIKGTILLAPEGINATISGLNENIQAILKFLNNHQEFADLQYKASYHYHHPFIRLKVKLKKEIVSLGVKDINPAAKTGKYIDPEDWNHLICDPDVITIDTRNKYEVKIGNFKNAINPQTDNFREFPKFFANNFNQLDKNTKIAMYCTGGIRCEKSTAYLLQLGFNNVYHLNGGILNYLAQIPAKDSLWQGECFLFDNRVSVDNNIEQGQHSMCPGCRYPISIEDKKTSSYKHGVYCPNCINSISEKTIKRAEARHKQIMLAKKNLTVNNFN